MSAIHARALVSREWRVCFVCMRPIQLGAGVQNADFGIVTHQGHCDDLVDRERTDFSRSRRGRSRSRGEVLRRVVEAAAVMSADNLLRALDAMEIRP